LDLKRRSQHYLFFIAEDKLKEEYFQDGDTDPEK